MPKFLVTVIREPEYEVTSFTSFTLAKAAYDLAKRDRTNLGAYLSVVIQEVCR